MLRNRIKSASKTRRVKEERKRALDIVSVSVFVRFVCYLPTRIDSPPPPQKKNPRHNESPTKIIIIITIIIIEQDADLYIFKKEKMDWLIWILTNVNVLLSVLRTLESLAMRNLRSLVSS